MKVVKEFSRVLVGAVFIFSGLIKINDPVGTAIKLEEYFEVFAYDFAPFFEYFIPASLFFSVFLNVLEVILGLGLLLKYQIRINAWILLLLILFFSFLTFYSAYFNKVTDCGCFGDAIKLTPWESFTKDIILLVFIGVIFYFRGSYSGPFDNKIGHLIMGGSTLIFVFLSIYAINHLPYIDFRPYAVGNNLPQLMQPSGELQYEYIMEKDGETYRFENYPTDESYQYVDMVVLNPEVQPKITDLAVWNDEADYTNELLTGIKLLVITHSTNKASTENADEIKSLFSRFSAGDGWSLTASGSNEYEKFAESVEWDFPYFFADATVLKTIIRSNPGIVLLQDGVVKGKWHYHDVPSISQVNRLTD